MTISSSTTPRRNAYQEQNLDFVIASEAKQSGAASKVLDCFVASLLAMTNLY
jgi:hypothetical protein